MSVQLCAPMSLARKPAVLSLHESGTARLCFSDDFSSFYGVMLSEQDEAFSIHGRRISIDGMQSDFPIDNLNSNINFDNLLPSTAVSIAQISPVISQSLPTQSCHGSIAHALRSSGEYELVIIDCETGTQYVLKGVRMLRNDEDGVVSFHSNALQYKTEHILIGNRADVEVRQYLGPGMVPPTSGASVSLSVTAQAMSLGNSIVPHFTRLHVGRMSVNFQAALTPPPTPSSLQSGDSSDVCCPMDEDFLK